jgi:hypothetical protein
MKPSKNPNSLWNHFGKPNLINGGNTLSKIHGPPPPVPLKIKHLVGKFYETIKLIYIYYCL